MKKIIIASFAFALIFASQSAMAASVWNGASNDCPGIAIANQTTNSGIVIPCWPLKSTTASDGNSVNIRFYYHNTSGQNATNVKFLLNAPTGASSSHTFSGQIVSDQGNLSLGTVSVTTPSGSSRNCSSAHWLPNQRQVESSIPFGQSSNGSEILGGGLNIGTVASSWDAQGSVVVAFSVSSPVTPPANVPSGTLTPNKTSCSIPSGSSSCDINFSWNTNNPVGTSAVTRDGGSTVATGNSGSKAFTIPYNTATFRLYNNGLELDSDTVTSYCTTGTSWNGSVCSENVNPNYSCSISNFTAGGALSTTVTSGSSVELAWTTTGCNYVNISDVGTNLPVNSTYTVNPNTTKTYTITGYGSSGSNPTRTVTVNVNPVSNPTYSCSVSSFTADGSSYTTTTENDSVELYWNTTNCNTVNIPGVGYNLGSSGRYSVSPSRTTRYTLTASGSIGGTQVRYVDVNVSRYSTPTYSCSINDFSVSNAYVTSGNSARLNWSTTNCNNVTITNLGNVYSSGSQTIYPSGNMNYVLTAYGNNGDRQTRNVYVNVNSYIQPAPTPIYNKCAVTTVATNISQTGAQLNGLITNSNGANAYFEYGPTVGLGYRTNTRYVNGNTNFSEIISSLSSDSFYYFRMVADCQGGTSQGSIEVFKTNGTPVAGQVITKTVYVQGKTVVGDSSPVLLKISNKYQMIGAGDLVDYVVSYKNIGKVKLIRPMVQVVLPTNITLVNSSRGTYAVDTHTLSAQIEDLDAGAEGVIFLQGQVDSIPLNSSQIPTTAILIYTSASGSQENAMAYVINVPRAVGVVAGDQTSTLGGAALFGGLLSIGLLGWLLIILIILIIILIVRSVYGRNAGGPSAHTPSH